MQKAEEFYKKLVDDNFAESLQSAKKQQEYIKTSTARYHGYFVHTLYMPKMFTEEMAAYFKKPPKVCIKYLKKLFMNIKLMPNTESFSVLTKNWKS